MKKNENIKQVTKEQIRAIKTIQTKHMGDEEYRELLWERFRVTSCTQLSAMQAGKLIDLFVRWQWGNKGSGFRGSTLNGEPETHKRANRPIPPSRDRQGQRVNVSTGRVIRLASGAQRNKIAVLADMIEWRVKDGLTKWIAKRFSIARVRTAQEAYRVIEGLKNMIDNAMAAQYGPEWAKLAFEDAAVRRYIQEHHASGEL